MARNVRRIAASPATIFAVLSDGWLYPGWVVGASRMRQVEDSWPQPGSHLYHSFGSWPFLIDDATTVEECEPDRRMVLLARGWPMGEARVVIDIKPDGDGALVRILEAPVAGPGAWLRAPLDPLLYVRNRETLRRLALLAEGGAKQAGAEQGESRPGEAGGSTE